jgi:DNA-binding beta-propeller fold protein YncE
VLSLIVALVLCVPGGPSTFAARALDTPPIEKSAHTIAVGGHPYQVAVDGQAERAFVMVGSGSGPDGNTTPNEVVVLDTRSDTVLQRIALGEVPGSLAVDERAHRVFVAAGPDSTGRQRVLMLDARTGAVLRTLQSGPEIVIDVLRNRVFSGSFFGSIDVFDARDGKRLGSFAWLGSGGPAGGSALAERAGRYYAAGGTDQVGVIDTAGPIGPRTFLGTITVHNGMTAMAVDEQTNQLFISIGCCWPYGISVLDARTGKLLGTLPIGREAHALVVDARTHRLFATSQDQEDDPPGYVYTIDLNGPLGQHAIWSQINVGAWVGPIAVDEHSGLVVVANAKENVVVFHAQYGVAVLDGKTGAMSRIIAVGYNPQSIAIDEQTEQVFVANEGDGTVSVFGVGAQVPQPKASPAASATTGTPTATAQPSETGVGGVASPTTPPVYTPTPTAMASSPTVTPTS